MPRNSAKYFPQYGEFHDGPRPFEISIQGETFPPNVPDDDDARPVIFLLTTQHSADAPKVDWDAVTITTSGQVVEGDGQVLQSFVIRPYPKELRESDYLVEDDAGRASLAFEFVDLGFDAAALKDRSEQGQLTTEIKFTLGDWYAACLIKFDGPLSEMLKLSGYKA